VGITSNDIAAQRAMIERGEEKRKAAKQAEERERLRDTFAAAALTGLVGSKADLEDTMQGVCDSAYRWADAMLRERARNSAVDDCETVGPAPAADGTGWPTSGAGVTLTDEERAALCWFAHYGLPEHRAATLRKLLERLHT
jgi:hypothetical protein